MDFKIQNKGNVLSTPEIENTYNKGVGELIFDMLREAKGHILQIDGISGKRDTYEAFLQRCIRTAIAMRSKGISSKDIITVCSSNHLDTNVPIVASLFLGVKTANTDPTLSLQDTVHLFGMVRPKMVFVSSGAVALIEKAAAQIGITPHIVVFGETIKHVRFSEFIKDSSEETTFVPLKTKNLKETAAILFSSGTSGLPKGICLSHLSFMTYFKIPLSENKNESNATVLSYSTPYWASSTAFLLMSVYNEMPRLILPYFDINEFWRYVDKYKVSYIFLTPYQISRIINVKRPEGANGLSVKILAFGGSHVNPAYLVHIKKLFPNISVLHHNYGQTEMGGLVFHSGNSIDAAILPCNKKSLSVGKPLKGYMYKIVDPETEQVLGPNQQGEIRIKSQVFMNGYYNTDSSNAWDADGFLKTGDVGYYDNDYNFYIVDRIKEIIKFRNWQIAPAKLEAILQTHPAVEAAAVIGTPHPEDGDHPMGLVVLKTSAGNVEPEEIARYLEENIDDDRCKLRAGVKIIDKIPVTPTGKYAKKVLREMALRGEL